MNTPFLSVVIPAYNLSQNPKPGALNQVDSYLKKQKYSWEVILVDDGSSDNTFFQLQEFARSHNNFIALTIPHGGKVAAIFAGVNKARGQIVLFTDFDQSTPISETEKFLPEFEKGHDIVIANRVRVKEKDSLASLLRSKIFNLLTQSLVLPGIPDTQCGFKAFKRHVAQELFNRLEVTKPRPIQGPYMGAFDVELLFIARKLGYKIKSVPVTWIREESKNLKFTEPLKMLLEIIKIRLFYLFSSPEK